MPMIICKECRRFLSDSLNQCPYCGCFVKENENTHDEKETHGGIGKENEIPNSLL